MVNWYQYWCLTFLSCQYLVEEITCLETILINVGGNEYVSLVLSETWIADPELIGNGTTTSEFITDTVDQILYQSHRAEPVIEYNLSVLPGSYEISLHFMEPNVTDVGQRIFDLFINSELVIDDIDILKQSEGEQFKATILSTVLSLNGAGIDPFIRLQLIASIGNALICGIEIRPVKLHVAHSVPQGPYEAVVDSNELGASTAVLLDGSPSHTHGPGLSLVSWVWKVGDQIVGNGATTEVIFPVGVHLVTLIVTDSGGNFDLDTAVVTIKSFLFPRIQILTPSQGDKKGGNFVEINGSGFAFPTNDIKIHFGTNILTGNDIVRHDETGTTLHVYAPESQRGLPVEVYVETPISTSNKILYIYYDGMPIDLQPNVVTYANSFGLLKFRVKNPSALVFGPDGKLYVGNTDGYLFRITLTGKNQVRHVRKSKIAYDESDGSERAILGIAFNPTEISDQIYPKVYISHSKLFHKETSSFSGLAINGRVSIVSGRRLNKIQTLISGLPVSDSDHGVNGLEFGNNGELYINIGGNTAAGVPGTITGSFVQEENFFSASTLVAYIGNPFFNGTVTYDANGNPEDQINGSLEIFVHGQRNPYRIRSHSNGLLYSTDNGPTARFGSRRISCRDSDILPGLTLPDKINVLVNGSFYGHPNKKRGETYPHQCTWRSPFDPSDANYSAPIAILPSSNDGLIEFQSNHFGGQLRGNLITSKYRGGLYRIVLSEDGHSVVAGHPPAYELAPGFGLDIAQSPDGTLFTTDYSNNTLQWYSMREQNSLSRLSNLFQMEVKSIFPRRGPHEGGSTLSIYGRNFGRVKFLLRVTVGGSACPIKHVETEKIECQLPQSGTLETDLVDVVVHRNFLGIKNFAQTEIFKSCYRYIAKIATKQ